MLIFPDLLSSTMASSPSIENLFIKSLNSANCSFSEQEWVVSILNSIMEIKSSISSESII